MITPDRREARVYIGESQYLSYSRENYDLIREAGGLLIIEKAGPDTDMPDPVHEFYPWWKIHKVVEYFDA